jgi:O-antigen ligase
VPVWVTRERVVVTVVVAAFATVGLLGPLAPARAVLIALAVLIAGGWAAWRLHPAWTLSAGLALSVMTGNWNQVGIPGAVAPDRLLLVAGIAAVLFRAPPIRDRARISFRPVHWAMVVTLLWMAGSGMAADTLSNRSELFQILERVGVLPFALFLVAPVVFDSERHRRILLTTLVGMGGYLGFTALMETLRLKPLVFPSFINDPAIGFHADRARGPFLEAVTNGAGLYAGIIAACIALVTWTDQRAREAAVVVLGLCGGGILFTETRSVWLGAAVATVVALLSVRELRYWFVPAVGAATAVFAVSLALVPGLAQAVTERSNQQRTVWDRENLATAAVNMVDTHPLLGIGWGRFTTESVDYFEQNPDFPLTATDEIIHNVFLTYAAETGLIGLGLWALTLLLGASAALTPGRPEARPWQIGYGAFLIFFLVISSFVFSQVFPNNMLWLLAGVAVGAAGTAPTRTTWPRPV